MRVHSATWCPLEEVSAETRDNVAFLSHMIGGCGIVTISVKEKTIISANSKRGNIENIFENLKHIHTPLP